MKKYHRYGIAFSYPEDWSLQEQSQGTEHLISVSSPETSFWSLGLFFEMPTPEHVVQTVLRALEEDYPEIDVYESSCMVLERPTVSREAEFVCMELLNSVWVRAVQLESFTVLVMYQSTDHELEATRGLLEAITGSLEYDPAPESEDDPFFLRREEEGKDLPSDDRFNEAI